MADRPPPTSRTSASSGEPAGATEARSAEGAREPIDQGQAGATEARSAEGARGQLDQGQAGATEARSAEGARGQLDLGRWTDAEVRLALLAAALGVRLFSLLVVIDGHLVPDEVFQGMEPGHLLAFGHGVLPWEYDAGLRSWVVPGLYACLFRFFTALGAGSGDLHRVAQILHIGLSLVVVDASYRIALRAGGRRVALLAGAAAAFAPPVLFWSSRTMTDCSSTAFLFWGFARFIEAAGPDGAGRRHEGESGDRPGAYFKVGLLFGVAYVLRPTAPIFCIGPGLVLLWRRRWREAESLVAGFLVVAVALGIVDWITWGRPFNSTYHYFKFNVVDEGSKKFGIKNWEWYVVALLNALGVVAMLTIVVAVHGARSTAGIGLGLLIGLAVMSRVPHKEERFALPILAAMPLFIALGASRLCANIRRFRDETAVALAAALIGFHTYEFAKRNWHPERDWYRAVRFVGTRSDAHGFIVSNSWLALGGYSLPHRDIPQMAFNNVVDTKDGRALFENELLDYAVVDEKRLGKLAPLLQPKSYEIVARFDKVMVLHRTRFGLVAAPTPPARPPDAVPPPGASPPPTPPADTSPSAEPPAPPQPPAASPPPREAELPEPSPV